MKYLHSVYTIFCAATLSLGSMAVMVTAPETVYAQSVELHVQTTEIYAGMPFQLSVVVSDFDENPQPEIMPFEIANADVQFINVSPRISQMTSIINGRRTFKKDVTFVYTYQITPKQEGLYTIPVIRVVQGSKESSTQPETFKVASVPTTQNMLLELVLPTQKIWVGQTFEVTLDWYLRKEVSNHNFNLPILNMSDTFEVEEPRESGRNRGVTLQVGTRQINFPYTRDSVMKNRLEYTRFRISLDLTAIKAGTIEIPASQVLAELESGTTQDFWGFGRANYQLFRAEDQIRSLTIQELPQANRPDTFSNAMGEDYTIQVTADRTIVKAGDPIILTIDISSTSSLDGLILPSLNNAGLNEQLFGVSNEDPIGENIDGAQKRNIRRFTVPVRIKSERVTEIPPLAFSYFNPKTEQYNTIHSQPVALSVTAVDKIGIGDVISNQKEAPKQTTSSDDQSQTRETTVDPTAGTLDLGLMSSSSDFSPSFSHFNTRILRAVVYVFPFLVWGILVFVRRSKKSRSSQAPQREAIAAFKQALEEARDHSARESSSKLTNALNAMLIATDSPRAPFQSISERIDEEAYRPNAGQRPLSSEILRELEETVSKNIHPSFAKLLSTLLIFVLFCTFSLNIHEACAQSNPSSVPTFGNDVRQVGVDLDDEKLLSQATEAYHKAMQSSERSERISGFKRASALFAVLAKNHPDVASFQVDSGNASLAAMDFAHASLYYHRALAIDPSIRQAKTNLSYIQATLGDDTASEYQLVSSVFFLNESITRDMRLLLAALFFAIGILLIIPWHSRIRRITSFLAVIPFLAWIWMLAGAYIQPKSDDMVVMTESYLKTADNAGSSNISAVPLEPGQGLALIHERDSWLQVETSSGQRGWISRSSVEFVKEK